MIAKKHYNVETHRYEIYLLPDNSLEDVTTGIPVKLFSLFDIDLEELDKRVNEKLANYVEKFNNTPKMDTLNQALTISIMKMLSNLGE